ncbi:MAG TPA: organomercurial lyase [Gammaproteobacteria bacterium]|nr:organomercurial lyase [Gammaproteobacteria bacterium]
MSRDRAIAEGLARLNALLPLATRQRALAPAARELHRAVLSDFVTRGQPSSRALLQARDPDADVDKLLAALAGQDLIVFGPDGEIAGAYPMTTEATPHRVQVNDHWIHAMCALDALAVAPMYDTATRVESTCHVTGAPVLLKQSAGTIVEAGPCAEMRVGIRWQEAGGCAAHSLCREMVFLADPDIASRWAGTDPSRYSLFTLPQAAALASAFFRPLVCD